MSVNLPFILLAAAVLGTAQAVMVGFISTFAQPIPKGRQKLNSTQLIFNCCAITLAVSAARLIYVSPKITFSVAPALRLALAAAVQLPLALLPIMAGVFHSYRRYFAATAVAQTSQVEASLAEARL